MFSVLHTEALFLCRVALRVIKGVAHILSQSYSPSSMPRPEHTLSACREPIPVQNRRAAAKSREGANVFHPLESAATFSPSEMDNRGHQS